MAKKKTKKSTPKKTASRFYVVRGIQDIRKTVTDRVETYHNEFIKDPIETGKEFVEDLREDPRKALNNLVDDSRQYVGGLKKDTRKKVDGMVADGRKLFKKARKNPRKTFTGIVDDGRDFTEDLFEEGKEVVKGIEKDARLVLDEVVESGRKTLDKLPGKKKFQRKIEKRIKAVPRQLNLPTRQDIDLLVGRLDKLNKKIDTLGNAHTA